jgi:hypothetical protein
MAQIQSVTVSPLTMPGSGDIDVTVTVTLDSPAPSGGFAYQVIEDPDHDDFTYNGSSLPASRSVPQGSTSQQTVVHLKANPQGGEQLAVTYTPSGGGSSTKKTLNRSMIWGD